MLFNILNFLIPLRARKYHLLKNICRNVCNINHNNYTIFLMIDVINEKHNRKLSVVLFRWFDETRRQYCIFLVPTFADRCRYLSVVVIRTTRGLDGTGGGGGQNARPAFGNAESVFVRRCCRLFASYCLFRRRRSESTCVFPRDFRV